MKTKILMLSSALFMAVCGVAATFMPQEIVAWLGVSGGPLVLVVQITGALYLGFAMQNWMARESVMGGIYNRPLATGNFMHFAVAAAAMVKVVLSHPQPWWPMCVIYAVFAIWFALVLFGKSEIRS